MQQTLCVAFSSLPPCACRSGWLKCVRRQNHDYYEDTADSQVCLTRADLAAALEPPLSMSLLTIGDTPGFEGQTIICSDLTSHSTADGYDPLQSFSYRRGSDVLSSDVNLQVPLRETHDTSSAPISSQPQECGEEVVAECMKICHNLGRNPGRRKHSSSLPDLRSCSRIAGGSSFSKSNDFETGFLHPPTGVDLPGPVIQTPTALDSPERIAYPRQHILQEHTPRESKKTGSLFSLTSQDSGSSTHSAPPALTRHMLVDKKITLVTPV